MQIQVLDFLFTLAISPLCNLFLDKISNLCKQNGYKYEIHRYRF